MLKIFEIELSFPQNKIPHTSMGSILHGLIMEQLPKDLATTLHTKNVRPYSQSIFLNKRNFIWKICTMDDYIEKYFFEKIQENKSFFLKQQKYNITVKNIKCISSTSFEDLFNLNKNFYKLTLTFHTPTSFKSLNDYCIFPNVELIIKNLLLKWNNLCPENLLIQKNIEKNLSQALKIYKYNLSSKNFGLEKINITGFLGEIEIIIKEKNLDEDEKNIIKTLLLFSPFAGIGIKTALGMGSVSLTYSTNKFIR